MHKRLPFYYITTLWSVAIVSVFLIIKPLLFSLTENKITSVISDKSIIQHSGENTPTVLSNPLFSQNADTKNINSIDGNDLVFYDKTAFIRYFSDKYSEEELAVSYSKAVNEKTSVESKVPVRVGRKNSNESSKISFSGGFDIRPVPVGNK